jgi:hypothetical protein
MVHIWRDLFFFFFCFPWALVMLLVQPFHVMRYLEDPQLANRRVLPKKANANERSRGLGGEEEDALC